MEGLKSELSRGSRLSRDDRRSHLLDVAAHLVREQGIEAVTMERLAETAGVSKGLGYAYFDNSDAVLDAVRLREVDRILRHLEAVFGQGGSFEHQLRDALSVLVDDMVASAGLFEALLGSDVVRAEAEANNRAFWPLVVGYYAALASSEFGLDAVRAEIASSVFLSGLSSITDRVRRHPEQRAAIEDIFIRLILGGMAALRDDELGTGE